MGLEWILGRLAWGVWIGFDWRAVVSEVMNILVLAPRS
jgi:hypothetical protein